MRSSLSLPLRSIVLVGLVACLGLGLIGCGGEKEGGRVLVLGLDGLDPQTVDLLVAEGAMPNFARLRREGAYGPVECPEPLLSPILWTTIATGKTASEHGISHFVAHDPASGEKLPVTSRQREVKALWNMAAESGLVPAVVGWWATWPPEDVGDGVMVSDHVAYHFLFEDGFTGGENEGKTHPPELLESIRPHLVRAGDLGPEDLAEFVDVPAEEIRSAKSAGSESAGDSSAGKADFSDELDHFRWALATARSYRDIGLSLWAEKDPDLQLVYIEATDSTAHLFGHLFRAEGLVGDLARQQERFGGTVEAVYRFADDLLGQYLDTVDENTTVIVVSDHGFQLGALHDDPNRAQDMRRVSERFHRDHGILYLWGRGIRAGVDLDAPHLLDVTPTALALLGLPVGEDMPGRVLAEALGDPAAVDTIASWEATGVERQISGAARRDGETDEAVLERLRGLGYLSSSEDESDVESSAAAERNRAAILFRDGHHREAARAYKKLVEASPRDPSLRSSFAGVLGTLGRYEEALEQLEIALAISPLGVEAYHNRAVILERAGRVEDAVADYSRAVRYDPSYEPSRRALERLIGTADVHGPTTDAERRAAVLASEAGVLARKGDYATAMARLDEAASIAPNFPLVWQYRSNVAYLAGDLSAAIAALEKGLELEPENALFHENLARLREGASEEE